MKSRNTVQDPVDVAFLATHPKMIKTQSTIVEENAFAAGSSPHRGGYRGRNQWSYGRSGYSGNMNSRRGGPPQYRSDFNCSYRGDYGHRGSYHYRGDFGHRGVYDNFRGDHSFRGNLPRFKNPAQYQQTPYSTQQQSVIYCWSCNQPGHKALTCREKDRKKARQVQFDTNRDYARKERTDSFGALSSLCFVVRKQSDWYADSGATHHMSDQQHLFKTFKPVSPGTWLVHGIGSVQLNVCVVGSIDIISLVNGNKKEGTLYNVLFVPGLGTNLFSIGTSTQLRIDVHFQKDKVSFKIKDSVIIEGNRLGHSLYYLKITGKNSILKISTATKSNKQKSDLNLWHLRMAHLNYKTILKMKSVAAVEGLTIDKHNCETNICEGCIFGEMHRSPFPTGRNKATEVGEIMHSDVGFVNVPTPLGQTCYALFKDDFTGWIKVYLLKSKSEADDCFIKFIAFIKTTSGKKVKILRTDQGAEYFKNQAWREKRGIVHQTTNPYTPQQNGVS